MMENLPEGMVQLMHPFLDGEDLIIHRSFEPAMIDICRSAQACDIRLYITSSFRPPSYDVKGAIVPPAGNSCHHVGHALDFNVITYNNVFYNSAKLANFDNLPHRVKAFLYLIRAHKTLRWGGDFRVKDVVHIDDNFYNLMPKEYDAIKADILKHYEEIS